MLTNFSRITGGYQGELCRRLGAAGQPDSGARGSRCGGAYHGGAPSGHAADELHPEQHQEPQPPQPLRGEAIV